MSRCHHVTIGLLLAGQAALAAPDTVEQLQLPLSSPDARVRIEAGREFSLSSANATIWLEGRRLDIFRFIISAADTGRVIARLTAPVWEPVAGAETPPALPPSIRLHSPQVWGTTRVVLLDVNPWRVVGGGLQVLRGGVLEVSIRHRPVDAVRDKRTARGPSQVANRFLVPAPRARPGPPRGRDGQGLRKSATALPTAGSWLKIPITRDGLYRLTGAYLSNTGLDIAAIDPPSLRLFAPVNLGRTLPDQVGAPRQENLVEVPRQVRDGNDGSLEAGDDLVFYAQGPRGVDLSAGNLVYTQNPYTDTAFVWLYVPDSGGDTSGLSLDAGYKFADNDDIISHGRALYHHEVDIFNGFKSGPVWHQTVLKPEAPFTILLDTPGLRTTDTTSLRLRVRGGSKTTVYIRHRLQVTFNKMSPWRSSSWSAYGDQFFSLPEDQTSAFARSGQNILILANTSTNPQDEIWIDWAELEYGLDLGAVDDRLAFLIPAVAGAVNIALSDFSGPPLVVDITDPARPELLPAKAVAGGWQFTPIDLIGPRRYLAGGENGLLSPGVPTLHTNLSFTDLRTPDHKADYIVITPRELRPWATQLAAIHATEVREQYRLDTLVATVEEIYEEFSGGVADPYAIRAFLRYAYESWQDTLPTLVALFGDGNYDYRNISGRSNNLVPTVQLDGRNDIYSRSADDRFVYLDPIDPGDKLPDMGIGRMAVATIEEAAAVVEQVRRYMVTPEPGAWRQRIVLAADDPARPNNNEPNFILDSEDFADLVPPFLQLQKIYLTEYTKVLDPSTSTIIKPDATADLIRQINQGLTLINYIGHGGATQWSQEALLKMERDRVLLEPGRRLPVWYAGTCSWGRYDQLDTPSMSEVITASTDIAGIAVISATRAVYSTSNTKFVTALFEQTFPDRKPSSRRIGNIFQYSRGVDLSEEDKFHLFGDPAIILAFPRSSLTIDPATSDTVMVLDRVNYGGATSGDLTSGQALITVVDAPRQVERIYLTKKGAPDTVKYELPGAVLFRGSVAIMSDGTFNGRFRVPKDISYSESAATIIAYAWSDRNGPLQEQIGASSNLFIRGSRSDITDDDGPLITVYWEGRPLYDQDALPVAARLEVELKDPLGVNLTGEVGHAIRVWIDDESTAQVMDPLFNYDTGSDTTGRFAFDLDPGLTGKHEITIEAWDSANNKTVTTIVLYLTLSEQLDVADLFNFPNPFQDRTEFVYTLSVPAQIAITVYTLNGVKVVELHSPGEQSNGFQRLPWNGRDDFGDRIANGAYLYQFKAETWDGAIITRWGRLARLQ